MTVKSANSSKPQAGKGNKVTAVMNQGKRFKKTRTRGNKK